MAFSTSINPSFSKEPSGISSTIKNICRIKIGHAQANLILNANFSALHCLVMENRNKHLSKLSALGYAKLESYHSHHTQNMN